MPHKPKPTSKPCGSVTAVSTGLLIVVSCGLIAASIQLECSEMEIDAIRFEAKAQENWIIDRLMHPSIRPAPDVPPLLYQVPGW